MARTREFNTAEALEKGMTLFWEKGYFDTSMDDLVKCTGVSRYGIYGEFGNKREFFLHAMKHYCSQLFERHSGELRKPDASLPEIRGVFNNMMRMSLSMEKEDGARYGCMICNTATELASRDDEFATLVQTSLGKIKDCFKVALDNAVTKGEVVDDLDTDATALFLVGFLQGLSVLYKGGFSLTDLVKSVDSAFSRLTV